MSPQQVHQEDATHYCAECGWRTDTDDADPETDCTERAIRHHVETGHTVVHRSADRHAEYGQSRSSTDRL
jgi:hypothetical protein